MNFRTDAFLQVCVLLMASTVNHAVAAGYPSYVDMSGQELFKRFCSSCHGTEAHGDGPVAASLDVLVPDLTLIEKRHAGKFPVQQIEKIIDGRFMLRAHGTRAMPVWGDEFTRSEAGVLEAESATRIMIRRMVEYLASIQQPAPVASH